MRNESTDQRLPITDSFRLLALKVLRRVAIAFGRLPAFQRKIREHLFGRPVTHFIGEDILDSFFLILSMGRSGSTLLCSAMSTCESVVTLSEPFLALETQLAFQSAAGKRRCVHPLKVADETLRQASYFGINENLVPYDLSDPKLRWLFRTADQVKTLCLVRDPRDIWSSVQQVTLATPYLSAYVEDGIVPPHPEWLETVRKFFRWALDHQRFIVRYEDFVTNPKHELQRISRYIGFRFEEDRWSADLPPAIGIGDDAARSGGRISTESIGKFRGVLTSTQISQINDFLRRELDELGYKE